MVDIMNTHLSSDISCPFPDVQTSWSISIIGQHVSLNMRERERVVSSREPCNEGTFWSFGVELGRLLSAHDAKIIFATSSKETFKSLLRTHHLCLSVRAR